MKYNPGFSVKKYKKSCCILEIFLVDIKKNLYLFIHNSISKLIYLRNMVHLPFFLQNSGLRKVKVAQQLAAKKSKLIYILLP